MTNCRSLFWHRKDLRIKENIGLYRSLEKSSLCIGVYIIDPSIMKSKNINESLSPAKEWFLINSLIELKESWNFKDSKLIILKGDPIFLIPKLAEIIKANIVCWNINIEPYEKNRDIKIEYELNHKGINVITSWDHLLINPSLIKNSKNEPYKVFTPFKNNLLKKLSCCELELGIKNYNRFRDSNDDDFINCLALINRFFKNEIYFARNEMKSVLEHNIFQKNNICPCLPGERKGNEELTKFMSNGDINNYNLIRDIPFENKTSKLSAGFNLGTIAIKKAWLDSSKILSLTKNTSGRVSIESWRNEIIWREFYQHALFHFPNLSKGPLKKKWRNFPWENNSSFLKSWESGETGIPIVDASIRQLKETGWMHNRCRMIVASFLVKDLICNWQIGEKIFMDNLVDGDLAANNGGWQWSASSGLDPKPLRIFNPYRQTKRFDENAKYIKRWIPELRNVSNQELISGSINKCSRKGYPEPIVNHHLQQLHFRSIFSNHN